MTAKYVFKDGVMMLNPDYKEDAAPAAEAPAPTPAPAPAAAPAGNTPKYIFENGMMKLNPAYEAQQKQDGKGTSLQPQALAVVSSMDDAAQASSAQQQATGEAMHVPEATQQAATAMQGDRYQEAFHSPQPMAGGHVVDKLTAFFAKYEVPLGMLSKCRVMSEYALNFMIDDSGSMGLGTDSKVAQVGDFMKWKLQNKQPSQQLTRWEEAEDRVHTLIDLLTYIPTGPVQVCFMNKPDVVVFTRDGKTPEQFAQEAHTKVDALFRPGPRGGTPTLTTLTKAFTGARPNTLHYLFTDGVPSDCRVDQLKHMVATRANAKQHPLTFVSCTDQDSEAEWMKEIEEHAPYCAEVDDFHDERAEVLGDQGPAFPFSRGFWLMCLLCGAINPDDLDAMDDAAPFSKMTMDNMMGRVLTEQEYVHYFRLHPQEPVVRPHYEEFAKGHATGKQIWQRHGLRKMVKRGGYSGGGGHAGGKKDKCLCC